MNSGKHPPHGMPVGNRAREVQALMEKLAKLCRENRVASTVDLPAEQFQVAQAIQVRIDALRAESHAELRARGFDGLAKSHEQARLRAAARYANFAKTVVARGGPAAINKLRLAAELGLSITTVRKYLHWLKRDLAAGGPKCQACGHPLKIDPLPTVHDETK
jgi:hypothetical protein